jgi:hypothetical protein
MAITQTWTAAEEAALREARTKLTRRKNRNTIIGLAGMTVTVVSFVVGQGAGVVFFGAIIAGTLYAAQDQRHLKKLDELAPGTPLNQRTLGIRTSADPPPRSQKKAAIFIGVVIALVLLYVLFMIVTYK